MITINKIKSRVQTLLDRLNQTRLNRAGFRHFESPE